MPLDITLFRTEGGNPEIIRESQRRRYASVELVDEIIAQDAEWRLMTGSIDNLRKGRNAVQKEVGKKMKAKESCEELVAQIKILGEGITKAEADQKDLKTIIDKKVGSIGKREPITHTLSNYLTIYYLAI
jgi:seryl-tRNA synthetase